MTHLNEAIALDSPTSNPDGSGGQEQGWTEQFTDRAGFVYQKGDEASQAGKKTGSAVFKIKMRQSNNSRSITTDWRLRDTRRSVAYNITEIDTVTDRHWVWLKAERGVAI